MLVFDPPVNVGSVADEIRVASLRMIAKIATESRDSQTIIASKLGVNLDKSITLEKDHFGIIFGQDLEFQRLRVEASLEFDAQLSRVVASHARFVSADGHHEIPIGRDLDLIRNGRHLKLLKQLDISRRGGQTAFLGQLPTFALFQPIGNGFTGTEVIDLDIVSVGHAHLGRIGEVLPVGMVYDLFLYYLTSTNRARKSKHVLCLMTTVTSSIQ